MSPHGRSIAILLADDGDADCLLTRDALLESHLNNTLYIVRDGEELLDFLRQRGACTSPGSAPRPGLILLDLHMPRLDGREALEQIKADPDLYRKRRRTSFATIKLGASSFISKPVIFSGLVEVMRDLGTYRFEIVQLPSQHGGGR